MSDALKPCPFCGGHAEIIEADEAGDMAYVVQCHTRGCEASSAVMFALKEDVTDQLVEKWNRRPAGAAAHLPSTEWLTRKVATDPDVDCEAGGGAT